MGLTTALPPAASPTNGRTAQIFEFVLLLSLGCARTSGARRVARGALAWRVGCMARWPGALAAWRVGLLSCSWRDGAAGAAPPGCCAGAWRARCARAAAHRVRADAGCSPQERSERARAGARAGAALWRPSRRQSCVQLPRSSLHCTPPHAPRRRKTPLLSPHNQPPPRRAAPRRPPPRPRRSQRAPRRRAVHSARCTAHTRTRGQKSLRAPAAAGRQPGSPRAHTGQPYWSIYTIPTHTQRGAGVRASSPTRSSNIVALRPGAARAAQLPLAPQHTQTHSEPPQLTTTHNRL